MSGNSEAGSGSITALPNIDSAHCLKSSLINIFMKIDIFIYNYGRFNDALKLFQAFEKLSYNTFLLNCEHKNDPPITATDKIVKLPNIFYSGQWNESLKLATGDVLFLINSDVDIPKPKLVMKRMEQFYDHYKDKAGLYAPNHYWTPWTFNPDLLETVAFGMKKVPATDSTLWSVRRDIAEEVGPVDLKLNPIGWSIEVLAAYYCKLKDMLVVRDYHVKCNHPHSSAYHRGEADMQWRNWIATKNLGRDFWDYYESRSKYGFGWRGNYQPALDCKML